LDVNYLQVLLIEPEAEFALFVKDVLEEIAEGGHWGQWIRIDLVHVETIPDEERSRIPSPGVVLYAFDEQDRYPGETLRRIETLFPQAPVILLSDTEDRQAAARLIRWGAQDLLTKKGLDCELLAHAMRNAIERRRFVAALESGVMIDPLTGLLNRNAFARLAERDRLLAERLQCRFTLVVAELIDEQPPQSPEDEQRLDLKFVRTADFLRAMSSPTDLIARISETRFAIAAMSCGSEAIESTEVRVRAAAAEYGLRTGAVICDGGQPVPLDALLEQVEWGLTRSSPGPNAFAESPLVMRR
jgi:DNA-binding NarL/FixJ family response regulator